MKYACSEQMENSLYDLGVVHIMLFYGICYPSYDLFFVFARVAIFLRIRSALEPNANYIIEYIIRLSLSC